MAPFLSGSPGWLCHGRATTPWALRRGAPKTQIASSRVRSVGVAATNRFPRGRQTPSHRHAEAHPPSPWRQQFIRSSRHRRRNADGGGRRDRVLGITRISMFTGSSSPGTETNPPDHPCFPHASSSQSLSVRGGQTHQHSGSSSTPTGAHYPSASVKDFNVGLRVSCVSSCRTRAQLIRAGSCARCACFASHTRHVLGPTIGEIALPACACRRPVPARVHLHSVPLALGVPQGSSSGTLHDFEYGCRSWPARS